LLDSSVAENIGDGAKYDMGGSEDRERLAVLDEFGLSGGADTIPVFAGIDGGIIGGPFDGADQGEAGAVGNGHPFGGFHDVGGFHAGFDGAEDVTVRNVALHGSRVNVGSCPD